VVGFVGVNISRASLFQPKLGPALRTGRDSPAADRVKFEQSAIEAQQILGLRRVGRASNGGLGILQ